MTPCTGHEAPVRWRPDAWEFRCPLCREWLPLTLDFWAPGRGMQRCRACQSEYYRARRCTTAYNPRDGVSIPPHETTRLPLTPVVAGSSHPRGVSA